MVDWHGIRRASGSEGAFWRYNVAQKRNVDSKLIMHRINFRSSTELEIIGVDDHMPSVLWTLRFLGGQSFKANKNIV